MKKKDFLNEMYLWWNHCEYKVYRIELRTLEVLKYQLSFSVFTIPLGLFPMALMPPYYYIYYFNKNFNFLYELIYFRALKMVGFLKNKIKCTTILETLKSTLIIFMHTWMARIFLLRNTNYVFARYICKS